MAGTKEGGARAAATNKSKYGADFYAHIGAMGGKIGRTGGFAAGDLGRERARIYGAIGGRKSKRRPVNKTATKPTAIGVSIAPPTVKPRWFFRIFNR